MDQTPRRAALASLLALVIASVRPARAAEPKCMSKGVIEAEIDEQIEFLHRSRSVFPRLGHHLVGKSKFEAPPYYRQLGFNVEVELGSPMTCEFIDGLNDIAHWINENFVLRLFAVLASHGLFDGTPIRIDVDGHEEMDILRRLRNKIGHGSGRYDPTDADKKKLYDRLVQHFKVDPKAYLEDTSKYPLAVGQVLVPLAEACKRYAVAVKAA
jgi:hypothetical protein